MEKLEHLVCSSRELGMETETEMFQWQQEAALAGVLALVIVLACSIWQLFLGSGRSGGDSGSPPEAAGRWPVIGHLLHLTDKKQPLARTLGALADKHGPLFTIWIGVRRAVVVSNWEMAKECFGTANDKALASRPLMAMGKHLGYNYGMFGLSQYGPYWREIRKIATLELLSARQLDMLKHVRATEVDLSIKHLYKQWESNNRVAVKVEMKKWFEDLTFNNVVRTVAGKRYFGSNVDAEDEGEAMKFRKASHDLFLLGGNPVPSDAIPALERLDIGGNIRAMKRTLKELDALCSTWLQEHRLRRLSDEHESDQDFLDVLLSTLADKTLFQDDDDDPDTVIKATCLVNQ